MTHALWLKLSLPMQLQLWSTSVVAAGSAGRAGIGCRSNNGDECDQLASNVAIHVDGLSLTLLQRMDGIGTAKECATAERSCCKGTCSESGDENSRTCGGMMQIPRSAALDGYLYPSPVARSVSRRITEH